ncbi:hypothetical protein BCR35DRAFT_332559 [Leucosporidium creatinivorum]|uniref:Cytidine deaminase-like protein n=1 Tax=Leucosporidium creatinivorum TaxID=106004 RepID=A0A1Y2F3X0_9BASI|nr:hypothetical protein BCR35DRAFT_332559 [Leucosporidium creatinivorum]
MSLYPPRSPLPTQQQIELYLQLTIDVADKAAAAGYHPFGSVLLDEKGEVLMEQGNVNTVQHAEVELARRAYKEYTPQELWAYTLGQYDHIGRIIYGSPETALLALTGDHPENPTMNLSCRTVLESGSKDVQVIGPVPEMEEKVVKSHRDFWASR